MNEQWQELKETITEMRDNNGTGTQQEVCKFLANLMDVLEKQMQEPSGDLISRDELLKAIDTWDKFGCDDTNSLFRLDNLSLPHFVPYIHYDDVVKCIKGMPSVNLVPSGDLISRQAVLKTLDNMDNALDEDRTVENYKELLKECYEVLPSVNPQPCDDAIRAEIEQKCDRINSIASVLPYTAHREIQELLCEIMDLPSVEQEPKTGHWRYVDYKNARCSNCNYIQTTKGLDKTMHCNIHKAIYKYCPNCGARMESEV